MFKKTFLLTVKPIKIHLYIKSTIDRYLNFKLKLKLKLKFEYSLKTKHFSTNENRKVSFFTTKHLF